MSASSEGARRLQAAVRGRSLWLSEALPAAPESDVEPLSGRVRADVCIVGGGFLGLWTALRLKEAEPNLAVVLLEKDLCGAGASGRNGGFVLTWWAKFLTLKKLYGAEEAIRLCRAAEASLNEIGSFCRDHGIGADFRHAGWLWTATAEAQRGAWTATVDELARYQQTPFRLLATGEASRLAGSARHLDGVFETTAATVQPAKLARALAAEARRLGVTIYEGTPMRRLERGRPARVVCDGGVVEAAKVVLALNAWGAALPELRRSIAVISSDIAATEPLAEFMGGQPWGDGLAISDSRTLVHYYRSTPDGRVVFGKGAVDHRLPFAGRVGGLFDGASPRPEPLIRNARWMYPGLGDRPWPLSWQGPIDKSMSGLPSMGCLSGTDNVFYGIGFSGNGVGPTNLCGRVLSSLVLGLKDQWSGCGLVHEPAREFPPEPLRFLGGKLVKKAVVAVERAEDAGRRPSTVARRLAAFAPAALSPTKPG